MEIKKWKKSANGYRQWRAYGSRLRVACSKLSLSTLRLSRLHNTTTSQCSTSPSSNTSLSIAASSLVFSIPMLLVILLLRTSFSRRGPWLVLPAGAGQCFLGYFLMWAVVSGLISRPDVPIMCLFMLLAAHA
ncbi:hypothetical protein F8388_007161 [Cannabis sativa]|uniref:Nodulin-like domain-containing protein n=1 Tax=Cannabis sativa TaxID=3483 RepID=A0A7J6EGP8_CANSA|nr:hypothetical protein F8388_007161 [Cannabis sativa]